MESASAPPTPASPPMQRGAEPVRPTAVPVTTTQPVRRQRRWALVAVGVVIAVIGVLAALAAVNQAGQREKVLVLAHDVPLGQKLTAGDLLVASVSADPALHPIKASQRGQVVGHTAKVALVKGGMLTQGQLATSSAADTQQIVGVQAKRGQMPAGLLQPGDKVSVVTTPGEGEGLGDKVPSAIPGTVVSLSPPDTSGAVVVNLAVAATDGPTIAARAAVGRVAIVREPRS